MTPSVKHQKCHVLPFQASASEIPDLDAGRELLVYPLKQLSLQRSGFATRQYKCAPCTGR